MPLTHKQICAVFMLFSCLVQLFNNQQVYSRTELRNICRVKGQEEKRATRFRLGRWFEWYWRSE